MVSSEATPPPPDFIPEGEYPLAVHYGDPAERVQAKLKWFKEKGRVQNLSFNRDELEVIRDAMDSFCRS